MWGTSVKHLKSWQLNCSVNNLKNTQLTEKKKKKVISTTHSKVHEGLDQRPNLDTDVAHTGVRELGRQVLQTLRDLALLGCGEWGVGDLRGVGL